MHLGDKITPISNPAMMVVKKREVERTEAITSPGLIEERCTGEVNAL